ncbi:MAG: FAD:protein FMN transferase, partial [Candidatus Omnitrophica bacterium]|nr:FAD:protein FMN transferase [Candidatus Omnitrophota bacterium]
MKRMYREVVSVSCVTVKAYRIFFLFFIASVPIVFLGACSRQPVTRTFVAAGTYLEVKSPDTRAAGIVYEEFKRLEAIFNFYSPDSELSRLNRTFQEPVKVSSELLEVLLLAQKATRATEGAFDVSYGALFARWKECIKSGTGEFPREEEITALRESGGMQNIEINQSAGTITIKKEGLKIDLGGIAEGYMVDRAARKLRAAGITSALINAGGDIYCMGMNFSKPWVIGIKDSRGLTHIVQAEKLVDAAVTTSGNYEQFFEHRGKKYSH